MLKKSRLVIVLAVVLLLVLGAEAVFAGSPIGYSFEISNEPAFPEGHSAVAYNPEREEYLVVWYNDRPGNDDIRAQRYNRRGQPMGGRFYISAGGTGIDRHDPSVAYARGENQYLVVWQHLNVAARPAIHGRRVSGTGQVLDATDLIIRGAGGLYSAGAPEVEYALAAGRYLVVWHESWHPSPPTTDIQGQAIKLDGQPDGSVFTIDQDPVGSPRTEPDLAYNLARNEFLVVWQQDVASNNDDIYGKRVKMAGGAGPLGSAISIDTDANEQWDPAVAALPLPAGMGQYMVVWRHRYTSTDSDIFGRTIRGDGTKEDFFIPTETRENEISPAIASSEPARRYLVTWTREETAPNIMETIQGQEVSMTRNRVGPALLFGEPKSAYPAVAGGPMGDFMITFDDTAYGVERGIYGQLWGTRMYIPIVLK